MRTLLKVGTVASVMLLAACGQPDLPTPSVEYPTTQASQRPEPPETREQRTTRPSPTRTSERTTRPSPTRTSEPEETVVESQPFNSHGLFGGTAAPEFGDGELGEVSILEVFPSSFNVGTAHIVFRNNTDETISSVDWTGIARLDGVLVGSGSSQDVIPAEIGPGEVGIGIVYFGTTESLPEGAEYEFQGDWNRGEASGFLAEKNLTVTELNLVGDTIVGAAVNEQDGALSGILGVNIVCFEGNEITGSLMTYADQRGPISPGEQVTFTSRLYECPTYAVSVGGRLD